MDQTTQAPTPALEILTRTRRIDENAARLQPLLQLLQFPTGPSPLDQLRETLVEILIAQRDIGERLRNVETMLAAHPTRD